MEESKKHCCCCDDAPEADIAADTAVPCCCRHKERSTWEIPGGHREQGENIFDTAQRELCEETGAEDFGLIPISVYGVDRDGEVTYGGLFCADVNVLGKIPEEMEIAEIQLFDNLPENLTYPGIQPYLYERVSKAVQ